MPKRRRERDRPKSGPDALYSANKRVLLSYASSDEEEQEAAQQPVEAAAAVVDDASIANYQMTEYPDDDDESDVEIGATTDRADDDIPPPRGVYSTAKETVSNEWPAFSGKDPATNQWVGIGPVSYGSDGEEEEYDAETAEALAYLKAVRTERHTIPDILAAPDADHLKGANYNHTETTPDDDDDDDSYEPPEEVPAPPIDDSRDPQKVFTRLLVERFLEQRTQLHVPPSEQQLAKLPDNRPISLPQGNNKAFGEWYRLLSTKAPLPAQLRAMDQESIFNVLDLVQKQYLVKKCKLNKATSAWIWSLLARLDDVGTMTNDEVYPLRELGKKAVFLLLSITSPEVAAQLEDEIVTDGSEQLTARMPAVVESDQAVVTITASPENTLATLDMILVVVGEVFGQKDLLEFRPTWSATERPA